MLITKSYIHFETSHIVNRFLLYLVFIF